MLFEVKTKKKLRKKKKTKILNNILYEIGSSNTKLSNYKISAKYSSVHSLVAVHNKYCYFCSFSSVFVLPHLFIVCFLSSFPISILFDECFDFFFFFIVFWNKYTLSLFGMHNRGEHLVQKQNKNLIKL